jgi:CRP-like cAMP-binding protein
MPEPARARILRELHLAAFGMPLLGVESWVTDRLTGLLEEDSARAGRSLFSAGEVAEYFYFLLEGRVELARPGAAPWTFGRRSVFGISDALLERHRQRTAIALTDVELMRVRSDAWIELLEDSFDLARASVAGAANAAALLEEALWSRAEAPSNAPAVLSAASNSRKLSVVERLAVLMDAPILRGAGVQSLSDLAVASEEVIADAGSLIFGRGGAGDRVFVLIDGAAEGVREEPRALWRGAVGDIVCGTGALGERASAWEARAVSRTRTLTFRLEDWFDLMEENAEMVRSTLGALLMHRERCLEELAARSRSTAPTDLAFA